MDCRYAEDLSDDLLFRRTEDATIPCLKILEEELGYPGVSQNILIRNLKDSDAICFSDQKSNIFSILWLKYQDEK